MNRPAPAALMLMGGLRMWAGLDAALLLLGLPAPPRLDRLARMHGILTAFGAVLAGWLPTPRPAGQGAQRAKQETR